MRIRIPSIYVCSHEDCINLFYSSKIEYCALHTWVGQEMATAALPSKPEVVHGAPLGGNSRGSREIKQF